MRRTTKMYIEGKNMSKELLLVDKQITALIFATSRFLESIAQDLKGYPDEKPNPDELKEMAKNIEMTADLREMLFEARDKDKVIRISIEEKDILI